MLPILYKDKNYGSKGNMMNRKADHKKFEIEPVSFDSTANVLSDDFLHKDYIKHIYWEI